MVRESTMGVLRIHREHRTLHLPNKVSIWLTPASKLADSTHMNILLPCVTGVAAADTSSSDPFGAQKKETVLIVVLEFATMGPA